MAENTNTERAKFEAWYKTTQRIAKDLFRDGDGYMSNIADSCWEAWQARAALSLPAAGQEPTFWVHRMKYTNKWNVCSKEFYDWVMLAPSKFPEDEVKALYAAPQPAVAAGWVMVPIEPTEEMLAAAHEGDREYTLRNFGDVMTVMQGPYDHWAAMLKAAPLPPAPSTEGEGNG